MRAKKDEVPVSFDSGAVYSRSVQWGDMNVAFEGLPAGFDSAPYFKGLPDDSCQCPHWGYLFKGRLRVIYADHEEVISAGEAYYIPPGHNGIVEEDIEVLEFSPLAEYMKTMEAVERNTAAMKSRK
jgi:hypothetical protein